MELDLSDNNIRSLSGAPFSQITSLQRLNLSGNSLRQLPSDVIAGLNNIHTIDLSRNELRDLPAQVFVDRHELRTLLLTDNLLTSNAFASVSVPSLTFINLSGNRIGQLPYLMLNRARFLKALFINTAEVRTVDANAFAGLVELEALQLDGNNITSVRREMFQPLTALRSLNIDGNSIVCTCGVRQFQDWLRESTVIVPEQSHCRPSGEPEVIALKTGNMTRFCDVELDNDAETTPTSDTLTNSSITPNTTLYLFNATEVNVGNFSQSNVSILAHRAVTETADNQTHPMITTAMVDLINHTNNSMTTNAPVDAGSESESSARVTWAAPDAPEIDPCARVDAPLSVRLVNASDTWAELAWLSARFAGQTVVLTVRRYGDTWPVVTTTYPVERQRQRIANLTADGYSVCVALERCSRSLACVDVGGEASRVGVGGGPPCVRDSARPAVVAVCAIVPFVVVLLVFAIVVVARVQARRKAGDRQRAPTPTPTHRCGVDITHARYQNAVCYQRATPAAPAASAPSLTASGSDAHTYEYITVHHTSHLTRHATAFVNPAFVRDPAADTTPAVVRYVRGTDDDGYLTPVTASKTGPATPRARPRAASPAESRTRADSGYKSGVVSPPDRQVERRARPAARLPARGAAPNLDTWVPVQDEYSEQNEQNEQNEFTLPTSPHVYTYVPESVFSEKV